MSLGYEGPEWGNRQGAPTTIPAQKVVERLDSYSQEEHSTQLEAARDRIDARKQARTERARRAATSIRAVSKPKMVMRSLRVPEKLWEAAKVKADEREENISDVLREALERYVRRR